MSAIRNDTPVLAMLYEAYSAEHQQEAEGIRAAFKSIYEAMNDQPLQEVDRIIYAVCTLCREHEQQGFVNGVRVGIQLAWELDEELSAADAPLRFKSENLPY